MLPVNKPKPLTAEEIEKRRILARQRHQERMAKLEETATNNEINELSSNIENSMQISSTNTEVNHETKEEEEDSEDTVTDDMFVAFARVYSGTLRKGSKIYVLTPKHDPRTLE